MAMMQVASGISKEVYFPAEPLDQSAVNLRFCFGAENNRRDLRMPYCFCGVCTHAKGLRILL
jgi:hypothetical protein